MDDIEIKKFYERYSPMVFRRCRYLLKDEDAALDAMQDVFLKVLQKKDTLKGDYPSALLHRIATNVCLNILRSNSRLISGCDEVLEEIATFEDSDERFLLRDMLDTIFKGEKPSTREMAVMFYIDGMTLNEVSDATGLSVSGVRKRLRLLREKAVSIREMGCGGDL